MLETFLLQLLGAPACSNEEAVRIGNEATRDVQSSWERNQMKK